MQKWEYCHLEWLSSTSKANAAEQETIAAALNTVRVNISKSTEDPTKLTIAGGYLLFFRTRERRDVTSFGETVAQLGLDGWELVSHTRTQLSADLRLACDGLMFKRPISE